MGKETGFLDYQRSEDEIIPVRKRIKNYNEFHVHLSEDERKKQGARCMNCGVPMCQSAIRLKGMVTGCPLHNLIPEWNDEIYHGHIGHALSRLLKTSSFPEFTGRVCPALCEKACNCGINDNPVTVHNNELFLIEKAFEMGYMQPRIPEIRSDKKIAVIGAGPAGLAVADRLNQRGHQVTVYEREDRIGGLLMYGIPNMKLQKEVIDRRRKLMEAEGITFKTGVDVGGNVEASEISKNYDAIVLCCGAKKARPLGVVNADKVKDVYYAVDFLKSTTKSLLDNGLSGGSLKDGTYISAAGKNVVIIGGGDTGNDCVGTCIRHGCKSVTQIEMMPEPPLVRMSDNPWPEWPKVLKTDYGQQEAIELFGHDPRIYETTVKELILKAGKLSAVKTVRVKFESRQSLLSNKEVDASHNLKPLAAPTEQSQHKAKFESRQMVEIPDSEKTIKCDLLIIAAGFTGCQEYTPDAFGVTLGQRGTVYTPDPDDYRTNVRKIFTAGDMHRGQSLVVWAINEGRQCARAVDEYLMGYTTME